MKLTTKAHEKVFTVMELFNILAVLTFTEIYVFVKTHRTLQQRKVNFSVHEFFKVNQNIIWREKEAYGILSLRK